MRKWSAWVAGVAAVAGVALAAGGLFVHVEAAPSADLWGCSSQYTPSQVDDLGEVCAGGNQDFTGWIYVDGGDGNPDPADGYFSASNSGALDEDGLCASTEGDPEEEYDEHGNPVEDDEETPSCNEDLWREAEDVTP